MRSEVLVTGATGFVGRRMVSLLARQGVATRALGLPVESATARTLGAAGLQYGDSVAHELVEPAWGDLTDPEVSQQALEGVRAVIHLAAVVSDWPVGALHRAVTVDGTRHLLEAAAARGVHVVLVSSIVVYGEALGRESCPEEHPHGPPIGVYGRSKQAQERLAWELEASRGLRLTIVRPGNIFGPDSPHFVHGVLKQMRFRFPCMASGGHQDAGLCYVENLCDLLARSLSNPLAVGRTYNANDGSGVTWRQYFADLARLAGAPRPRSLPLALYRPATHLAEAAYARLLHRRPPMTREALNLIGADHRVPIDRARRELGYGPPHRYEDALSAIGRALAASPAVRPVS